MGGELKLFLDVDPVARSVVIEAGDMCLAELPLAYLAVRFFGEVVLWIEIEGSQLTVGWEPSDEGIVPFLIPTHAVGDRRWRVVYRPA